MAGRAKSRREFLKRYRRSYPDYKEKAALAESFIRSILENTFIEIHDVSARAKEPTSVHLKLLKKKYARPASQLTDKIGVRIITYYAEGVDRVVDVLKSKLQVDLRKSVDKRTSLGLRSFGYRSVHLIARLHQKYAQARFSLLAEDWFEVQVRSILEHAWAEIEHEVVFKAGVDYPSVVHRRFAALAGAVEILDTEFARLRLEKAKLIAQYRVDYEAGRGTTRRFDAARLLAFLECEFPDNFSWRQAEMEGRPFAAGIEATCVAALAASRIITADALRTVTRTRAYRRAVRNYAAGQGLKLETVSHFALVLIAIALRNPRVLQDYFPGMPDLPLTQAVPNMLRRVYGDRVK